MNGTTPSAASAMRQSMAKSTTVIPAMRTRSEKSMSIPDTKNSFYLDGTATVDLGGGWGVIGHLGRQKVRRFSQASYTDWKLGVTKDVNGFVLGVSYVDTNADPAAYTYADARRTMNIGRSGLVFSVSKTF